MKSQKKKSSHSKKTHLLYPGPCKTNESLKLKNQIGAMLLAFWHKQLYLLQRQSLLLRELIH